MSETKEKAPTLEERLAKAEAENAKLKGKVKDLSEELKVKEATAPANSLPTVKVNGAHYQFISPRFKVGKEAVSAVDAAKNADLCAALVAKKSGVLKAVTIK